ncbi:MAG: hypothetical protein LBR15_02175 [Methanobrevibacter sp.]|nr:hypothetical protein [Candidatus Methanovirga australis]
MNPIVIESWDACNSCSKCGVCSGCGGCALCLLTPAFFVSGLSASLIISGSVGILLTTL